MSHPSNLDQPAKPKKRIFRWFFLAVQFLFLIWIISAISSSSGTPEDCGSLSAEACNAAEGIGTGLGVAFIIVLWLVVDAILAVTYLIFRKK